jgi:hypothetical protein
MSDNIDSANELKRELAAKVVDRILSDASFRQAIKTDPDGAMQSEFGAEWTSLLSSLNSPEVSGYLESAPIEEVGVDTNCCQGATCVYTY